MSRDCARRACSCTSAENLLNDCGAVEVDSALARDWCEMKARGKEQTVTLVRLRPLQFVHLKHSIGLGLVA
jgi:hypothetical protein